MGNVPVRRIETECSRARLGGEKGFASFVNRADGTEGAGGQVARAEVRFGASSPFFDEVVVEDTADGTANDGDKASCPFFGDFHAHFGGHSFDDARNKAFDDFFFDEVAAEVHTRGGTGCDPQLDDFFVRGVVETVDQTELL